MEMIMKRTMTSMALLVMALWVSAQTYLTQSDILFTTKDDAYA